MKAKKTKGKTESRTEARTKVATKARAEVGALEVRIGYAGAPAGRPGGNRWNLDSGRTAGIQESGDTVVSCKLADGSVAIILSDGMGKGKAAAAESGLVVGMLRRRLKQGLPVAGAIRAVNRHLLRDKKVRNESFATVDLVRIDRRTGSAHFYKMGAAPSYVVLSGRRVRRLEQPALPVGILPTLKLTHVTARLHPGDIIVMLSDGILDMVEQGDDAWLTLLLSQVPKEEGPRQLAVRILLEAQKRCDTPEPDDATVAVAMLR